MTKKTKSQPALKKLMKYKRMLHEQILEQTKEVEGIRVAELTEAQLRNISNPHRRI